MSGTLKIKWVLRPLPSAASNVSIVLERNTGSGWEAVQTWNSYTPTVEYSHDVTDTPGSYRVSVNARVYGRAYSSTSNLLRIPDEIAAPSRKIGVGDTVTGLGLHTLTSSDPVLTRISITLEVYEADTTARPFGDLTVTNVQRLSYDYIPYEAVTTANGMLTADVILGKLTITRSSGISIGS